jgi:hypothetical protein
MLIRKYSDIILLILTLLSFFLSLLYYWYETDGTYSTFAQYLKSYLN